MTDNTGQGEDKKPTIEEQICMFMLEFALIAALALLAGGQVYDIFHPHKCKCPEGLENKQEESIIKHFPHDALLPYQPQFESLYPRQMQVKSAVLIANCNGHFSPINAVFNWPIDNKGFGQLICFVDSNITQ